MILLITLLLLIIFYILIGIYFYNISINSKTDKSYLFKDKKNQNIKELEKAKNKKWLNEVSKNISIINTSNKLKLHAYEIINKKETNIWTIIIHGYGSSGEQMATYAKKFYNKDYNVLVVDLRGHGKSAGNYIGMGWPDRLDIIDWINYLIKKDKKSKIILFGVSMGAATVMNVTGENLPKNVQVAIEDCGYTSAREIFSNKIKKIYKIPPNPIIFITNIICKIKTGYSFNKSSCIKQIQKSKIPTLFIHGDKDTFVEFYMLDLLFDKATCTKEKLVIKNAGHGDSEFTNPKLYWDTIKKFIEKNLK